MAYLLMAKRHEDLLRYETVGRWVKGLKEGSGRRTALYHLTRYMVFLKNMGIEKTPDQLIEECFEGNNRTLVEHLDMAKKYVEGDSLGSLSRCSRNRIYTSIRSFYLHNRVTLPKEPLRFNDGNAVTVRERGSTMLEQIKKAVSHKGCSVRDRAIILCMVQSGMDDSTLSEVFNHVAYPQLVKYFGTEDHSAWSLEKCPVRIDLVRPKTGYRYYSFVDRDAVEALKDWFNVRFNITGEKMHVHSAERPGELPRSDPVFIVKNGQPVRAYLVSKIFRDVGVAAGIVVRPSGKVERFKGASRRYAFHSHEVRDLLKSLARVCGVDGPVADFFLGHGIDRLGYDKSPWDFPEHFREQYVKMSSFLNVLTGPAFRSESNAEMSRRLGELEESKATLLERLVRMEQETKSRVQMLEEKAKRWEDIAKRMEAIIKLSREPLFDRAVKDMKAKGMDVEIEES